MTSYVLSKIRISWIMIAVFSLAVISSADLLKEQKAGKNLVRPKSLQTAELTTGTGDCALRVTVTPYGTFGSSTYGGDAFYNPAGISIEAGTVFESAVYFTHTSGLGLFLHSGDIEGQALSNDAVFTSVTSTSVESDFIVDMFSIHLLQQVEGLSAGSKLTQRYTFTNNHPEYGPQTLYLLRHVDGDLKFDGTISDLTKVVREGDLMYEFDSGDNPSQPVTFFAIETNGDGAKAGYRVAAFRFTDDILALQERVLTNVVDGDANGDGMTDTAADWTMTMGRKFSDVSVAPVTFETTTTWGTGAPNSDPLSNTTGPGPVIKANGARNNAAVNSSEAVSVAIELNPGDVAGVPVDWWAVAHAGGGGWYYLNSGMQWVPFNGKLAKCRPFKQGPLYIMPSTSVLDRILPLGSYTFWFAVDYPMDTRLNVNGPILVDSVNVTVAETPAITPTPQAAETILLDITSLGGVSSNPTVPSTFTTNATYQITYIQDYHYFNYGALPGTIALHSSNGTAYGPWQTTGLPGQGGVANAYWLAHPNETIPAGTYTVIDSDNSTWSQNAETGHRGISMVKGVLVSP